MPKVSIFEAKTHFSRVIDAIASREEGEFVVTRNGKPVARIVPIRASHPGRRVGVARGQFDVPDDIDASNAEIARLFAAGR